MISELIEKAIIWLDESIDVIIPWLLVGVGASASVLAISIVILLGETYGN